MSIDGPFRGPVFVVGTARSGTKLLRSLLKEHPRIAIPEVETEMLPWLAEHLDEFGDLSDPERFRAFHRWCQDTLYFRDQRARGVELDADTWYRWCRSYDVAGVFEAMVRHDADVPWGSDRIWGDKSPTYLRHLGLLGQVYPQARIVHIVRDARDVALSTRDAWGKHLRRTAQRWVDDVRAARARGRQMGDAYVELRFEDLLAEPEAQLRRVTDALGIAFDEEMVEPSRPTENIGTARGRRGLHQGAAQRWREQMTDAERRGVEEIAGALLQELGYALPEGLPPQRRLGPVEQRVLHLLDGLSLARIRLRSWGVRGVLRYGWRAYWMPRS